MAKDTTNSEGFVVSRNKHLTEFFTATSSYDRASWVDVSEATVYHTDIQAADAVKKLWQSGQFGANAIPLTEAKSKKKVSPSEKIIKKDERKEADMCFDVKKPAMTEMADCSYEDCEYALQPVEDEEWGKEDVIRHQGRCYRVVPMHGSEGEESASTRDEQESYLKHRHEVISKAVAAEHGADDEDEESEATKREQKSYLKHRHEVRAAAIAAEHGEEEERAYRPARFLDGAQVHYNGEDYTVRKTENGVATLSSNTDPDMNLRVDDKDPEIRNIENESLEEETKFKMPAKPAGDQRQDTPGDQVVSNLGKPYDSEEVEFEDPNKVKQDDEDLNTAVGEDHDDTVRVPAQFKKLLKDVIDEFSECADWNAGKSDDDAAYCKTVADALQEFGEILHLTGYENEPCTVGCVKKAQLFMNSLMGPIQVRIPEEIRDWVDYGGRRKTLKDLYNLARDKSDAEINKEVRGPQKWAK